MFKALKGWLALRRLPESLAKFEVSQRLDQLITEYRIFGYTGTGISLDRDGFTKEQIDEWFAADAKFVREHSEELLKYLEPYEAFTRESLPDVPGLHFTRWYVLQILKLHHRKAETK